MVLCILKSSLPGNKRGRYPFLANECDRAILQIMAVKALAVLLCLGLSGASEANAQNLEDFDGYVTQVMKDFKVPGVGIAVVKDGKVILAKGYGFRDAENHLPLTTKTLFPIASITKSFTVTTLGMLVDEGKLNWDKPVREYLPGFRMYDPVSTDQLTPRDLVTHRSGLPRHDLIWYASSFSRKELVEKLRYLEPNKPLRQTFQYNNLMFITAGYLAGELDHSTWEDAVRQHVLEPLGMRSTVFNSLDAQKSSDYAQPYRMNYKTEEVKKIDFADWGDIGPAGAINSNIDDLSRYLLFHLNKGKADGKQLLSANNAAQMQTPQMVIQGTPPFKELGENGYGMGFFISSYRGHKLVEHGGNLDGFSLNISFLPNDGIGVVVLTNLSGTSVRDFLPYNVFDRLLGLDQTPWSQRLLEQEKKGRETETVAEKKGFTGQKPGTHYSHDLQEYFGDYTNVGYGRITIASGKPLTMTFERLTRPLEHFHYETFTVPADPLDSIEKLKVTFITDLNGEVSSISLPLEPHVKAIIFERTAEKGMFERTFLERFTGDYDVPGSLWTVALQGESKLVLTRPGSPALALVPKHGTVFELESLPGETVEFKDNQAILYTADGVSVFKKK
jgi:CubicO group peptidase (beta-lactamase class C family)